MVENSSSRVCANDDGAFYKCEDIPVIAKEKDHDTNLFKPDSSFQTINEYTEQMVHVLYQKVSQQNIDKAIGVLPFVSLSSTGEKSQKSNTSVAEAFVADMQNMGIPVSEFIISNSSDFDYVLKGTMKERRDGTMVYAKIINLETKEVIASTSKFLPNYLLGL